MIRQLLREREWLLKQMQDERDQSRAQRVQKHRI